MALVRPIEPFASSDENGEPVTLVTEDLLDESDFHVRRNPHLFAPADRTTPGMVEQATSAPGRSRGVRVPKG
jgi:hypothetical protein